MKMNKVKIGISCKDINKFDECLRIIEKYNLFHIELQVSSIEKNSFIYSEKMINNICRECSELGITVSIHSFTGINLSEKITRIRNEIIKITKEIIDITEYMSGTHLILHMGNAGFRFDCAKKNSRLDYAICSINELEEYSRNMIMNIAIENVDRLDSNIKCYLGDCIEDFEYVIDRLIYPDIGVLFDVGHMNLSNNAEITTRRFLDQFYSNIVAVHLHTNNGLTDQHLGVDNKWFEKYRECLDLFEKLVILENYSISEMEKSLKHIALYISGDK